MQLNAAEKALALEFSSNFKILRLRQHCQISLCSDLAVPLSTESYIMRFMRLTPSRLSTIGAVAVSTVLASAAFAQDRHELRGPRVDLDVRYHHDRYYPPRGFVMERLPAGSVSVSFGSGLYFFHAGVWFRPVGPRFEVITPPLGIVIPALPPGYVSLTLAGAPYFYANGVYYAPSPGAGYVVVEPPVGAEPLAPIAAVTAPGLAPPPPVRLDAPAKEPIVYPRNGQSAAQIAADREQCRQWADIQPGAASDGSVFERALGACLDGRGYTIR